MVGEALLVEPYAIMLSKDDPTFKTLVNLKAKSDKPAT